MSINVEAVLIVSALIFVTTMIGLAALWMIVQRDNKAAWRRLNRSLSDRN